MTASVYFAFFVGLMLGAPIGLLTLAIFVINKDGGKHT